MTVRSNAVSFEVLRVAPLPGAGWEVRVCDYRDYQTEIAVIAEWASLAVGPELSAAGQGAITFDQDGRFWNSTLPNGTPARTIKDHEYLFRAFEDGVLRFEWLGRNRTETILDPSETRTVTIAGPGGGDVLKWAKILPPGFPQVPPIKKVDTTQGNSVLVPDSTSADNGHPAHKWDFPPNTPAMSMYFVLLKAAQSRGTLKFVTPTFTNGADSGGVKWNDVRTVEDARGHGFQPDMGTDLLAFIDTCTGQKPEEYFATHAEWLMRPGFDLEVRNVRGDSRGDIGIGTHRQHQVIFYEGGLTTKERKRTSDEVGNYVVVRDAYGTTSHRVSVDSAQKWHQREVYQGGAANVTESARRNALADVYLEKVKDETSQWTIQVPYDLPGRRPFVNYDVGDWIGVSGFDDNGVSKVDAYRVMAMTVTIEDEATVELTLQSKFDLRQRQLAERITQIINKVSNATSTTTIINENNTTLIDQIIRNPDGTIREGPYINPTIPGYSNGTVSTFIQDTDPGDKAAVGSFWLNTNYTPPDTDLDPNLVDPDDPSQQANPDAPKTAEGIPTYGDGYPAYFVRPIPDVPVDYERVPGTNIHFG